MEKLNFKCPHCNWSFISLETTGVTTTRLLLLVSKDGEPHWSTHIETKEPDTFDVRRTFQCSKCHSVLHGIDSEEELIKYLKEQNNAQTP